MKTFIRAGLAAAGAIGLLAAPLAVTDASAVSPYTDGADVYLSTTNPAIEAVVNLLGDGFLPFEIVKIQINAPVLGLVTVRVGPDGTFNQSATMPEGYACNHTIKAKGKESKSVVKLPILIGNADSC
jgi:hypothetical protein